MFALNADFTQADNQAPIEANGLVTNGKMWIGSTAVNAGGTHINVGSITSPDSSITIGYNSPNITLQIAGGTTVGKTITGDTGGALSPTSGNWNILGQQAGTIPVMDTIGSVSTLKIEDRTWQTRLVVDPSSTAGLRGTYTTIALAVAAASSGDTIFIRPGTYTENFSVATNLYFVTDSAVFREGNHTVTITGTVTISTGVSVSFNGIRFNTNSAVCFSVTGNAALVTCQNCYFDAINANCISCTGNSSTNFYMINCSGLIQSTFALFTTTSALVWIKDSFFIDITGTPAASSTSTGIVTLINSRFSFPFSTSSTGIINASFCQFGSVNTPFLNVTWITTAGSGISIIDNCLLYSGTASAISIGTGTTVNLYLSDINSSNTNAITGAGTINYSGITFSGSSSTINTTTKTISGTLQGSKNTAPTAGFLGEQIISAVGNTGISNNTATNLLSIALTAGIWDVSCVTQFSSGGVAGTKYQAGISTTSATFGALGDSALSNDFANTVINNCGVVIPSFRITLSATTTTYLVVQSIFGGTMVVAGRISATRVG